MTFRIIHLGITLIAAIGVVFANDQPSLPLVLPPGLEQTLPVNPAESYFGEAIRPVDCPDDDDNPLGTCGNLLFGGLALNDSHINGEVKIKFYPPMGSIAHFEIFFPTGLRGGLEMLSAPQLFRMPVELSLIENPQDDIVSEGDLNLETGEVTNLNVRILVHHTGLVALDWANPELERPVIEYPGIYGSSWAEFEQRGDGLLDFSFRGSTFLPLGKSVNGELGGPVPRFPLPFCDNELNCASIPSPGTAFHPHLVLTTKQSEPAVCEDSCLELPTNTIWEFDTFTRNTSFGDEFNLNIPELGGSAK